MSKSEIVKKLETIAAELSQLESEAALITGHCSTAVELATLAVNHAMDLVDLSEVYKGRHR